MKIIVENLHSETTSEELLALCSQFGTVLRAEVTLDPATGSSRGQGVVEMTDGADAAVEILNRYIFQGKVLKVTKSAVQDERRRPLGKSKTTHR